MPRIIGIRHQEKGTVAGEMRPTQFFILEDDGASSTLEFEDVLGELNWLVGKYALGFREVTDRTEDLSMHAGSIKFGPCAEGENLSGFHPSQLLKEKGKVKVARKVPSLYDGVRPDDIYVAMMGGSGHQLVAGLSARLEKLGGSGAAYHVPPNRIADRYGKDRDKDNDAFLVIGFFKSNPELFYKVLVQDRLIANVKSCWANRKAAQFARIAHGLRLRKVALLKAYAEPEAYAGAGLEVETLKFIAGDIDTKDLESDESAATTALKNAVEATEVWTKIFDPLEGVGPAIAGGIIAAIGDIRRFKTPWQLAKFCGVACVTKDVKGSPLARATIQRRRSGEFSGWNNDARKCLWNFADQCNRRPSSVWGQHLLAIKAKTLELHPEPVEETSSTGKKIKRYTKGHIHKMAIWRLQTDFICVIWRQWKRVFKYPGDLYYTKNKNDLRPPGSRNTDIITEDLKEDAA